MTGRPRSFDRDAALSEALDLFWQQGFEMTSMAELTSAMGISPPSLYAAFGNKRQLFDEVVERYQADLAGTMVESMALAPARIAVREAMRAAARLYTARDRPRGCLVMSEALLTGERAAIREAFLKRLELAVRDGEFDAEEDIQTLASYVEVVLAGMSVRARDGATLAELQEVVDRALSGWPDP